jgi:hypothetical protein
MEKLAQAGAGGGALPPLFTLFTITYKVAAYTPAETADKLTLFHLDPYVLCGPANMPYWTILLSTLQR